MKKVRYKRLSIVLLFVLVLNTITSALPQQTYAAPEEEGSLILHYDMTTTDESEEKVILKDVSGSSKTFDGIFQNPENGDLVKNDQVGYVAFNGGSASSNSGYVEIPKAADGSDVLSGLEDVTVSTLVNWSNTGTNRWIFGLGKVSSDIETGNAYFFATPRHGSGNVAGSAISEAGWRNESLVKADAIMAASEWKVVTAVFSGSTDKISLYIDGKQVASGSAGGKKLANIIDSESDFSGFLGKSIFTNDAYFKGMIGDFRIYNKALTAEEVATLSTETSAKATKINQLVINDAQQALDVSDYLAIGDSLDTVTKNLNLPTGGRHGVTINWKSSNPDVIANDGSVTRPPNDAADTVVELTASLTHAGLIAEKTFTVTVLKEFSTDTLVQADADALTIYNQDEVKGNLKLPVNGDNGSTISWESSNPNVIKGSDQAIEDPKQLGWVTRPSADTTVTLTATVTKGDAKVERQFDLTVIADPGKKDYDAYFFSYFTGEYEGGEEISFATAKDPLKWRALNNGQSVIQSTMGEKGLRDPFIMRSPEGDKFYLIATDLKMGESTNFDEAQITGSHSIMVWESDDLINWSEQRMVEVAPKNGGNTWAPEAFYNKETGEYVVFWASSIPNEETYGNYPNGRPNGQYNVMYYATTRDFHEFSEPKVLIDEGFPTIDTTMVQDGETLYRFTKSEVNYKVYYEKATNIFNDLDGIGENGFQFEDVPGTQNGNQGLIGFSGNNEGQTVFKSLKEDKWYLFLDSWPYHVRYTTDLEDGAQLVNNVVPESDYALPPGPRHGTVIPITNEEYESLQDAYALPTDSPSEKPVVHYSFNSEDVDGTTVKDVSGNGHDAELVGGASLNAESYIGDSGASVDLDGSSGYVKMPENLIQDLNLSSATISTWVNVEANSASQRIFDFASDTGRVANRNTMYLSTQGDTGQLEFAIVTPFTEKFSSATSSLASDYKYALRDEKLDNNIWKHVAVTIDGFDAVLYVDGKEVTRSSTFNMEPRMLLETTINYLGKSRNNAHSLFDGKFDDFRIYNRALPSVEVAQLADQPVTNNPGEIPDPEPTEGELILNYDFANIEGTTVKDTVGNFDGTIINPEKADVVTNGENTVIDFVGGNTDSFIELPQGILDGLESITVSSLVNWDGKNGAEWLYTFGQDSSKYLYYTPKYNADSSARFGIATNTWRNEVSAKANTQTSNKWKLVTTVFNGAEESLTIYLDGEEVATASTNGLTLADIKNTDGISGYIGKSFYSADPYFGGMISDFEVYNGVLSNEQIEGLAATAANTVSDMKDALLESAADALKYDDILNGNENENSITTNLVLPTEGDYGTTISWESSQSQVVSTKGTVHRPTFKEGDQTVTLTATISDDTGSVIKEFKVTVMKKPESSQLVLEDAKALNVYNIGDVRGNLTLPTEGENGSSITWNSADTSVVTTTGEVNRPKHGDGNVKVKLIAKLELDGQIITKAFMANVKEMPKEEDYKGYLFSYFTGEGYENGEQIYFGLSEGNDPLHWQPLNNGEPIFTSELGEKGLRDPFIIRSPEGDKFYMIATDLKMYGNGDWGRAQTEGSRSIMVWESNDLINWSEQRMAEVAPEEAGNTWAPEIFYDKTIGQYVIFWASKLYETVEDRNSGNSYQRMMYTTTRDFHTFSEPKVYMDYGYSIIDTTMIEHNGKIYRFTKDERGNSSSTPNGKFIFQEVGDTVLDPNFELIKEGIGKGDISRGEGPLVFKSNTEEKWYMFIDEFGGRGYVPFETTDLNSGEWAVPEDYDLPDRPRHGTVLPVTQAEYDALASTIPVKVEPNKEDAVTGITLDQTNVNLTIGKETQLTATVTPENAVNKEVLWSSNNVDSVIVTEDGTVTAVDEGIAVITATTVDGGFIATSEVHVNAEQPGDGSQPPGDNEDPDPETPGDNGKPDTGNDNPDQDGEDPGNEGEGDKASKGETPGENKSGASDQNGDSSGDDKEQDLPNTATNLYNYLVLGVLLLVLGLGIVFVHRKRNMNL
ncbi:immunoglobulin-like domain-containing protein [Aquibacillus kalidii]|uniref:immunoglobulin-like domain-containing protein n=1 Tax=Aquibacillus kalidii TaxID=2762597 RepID=UPI0016467918|nr:immunoglobulin-like domain-containing protein [Aquibacillus kalidii]